MKYKIVYNDCYGGYTLSYKAIDWLSEQRSQWYFIDEYDGRETVVTPADLSWEVIDEYDDMMVAAAPPVDVCWTGIEQFTMVQIYLHLKESRM